MTKWLLATGMAFSLAALQAQKTPFIIPQPQSLQVKQGQFDLSAATYITANDASLLSEAIFFNRQLQQAYGFSLPTGSFAQAKGPAIFLELKAQPAAREGSYTLQVTPTGITITGYSRAGIFYGLNSLFQLIHGAAAQGGTGYRIPAVTITDTPGYDYRGMMLDVARHFRSVAYIKQTLDRMALLKFNVFHWHLTEDQGWRIEIKKYPKLTEVAAWRDGTIIGGYPGTGNDNLKHGGFYTQEQVKEIVAYAAARHITVIPEIEMPGHSSAAIAAYPWLSCFPDEETIIPKHPSEASKLKKGKKVQESWGVYEDVYAPTEETFQFLQDVIDEIVPLFPGKYIHIGGDECPKEAWKRSAFCQQLIKEKGLKDEHELQSYFIQRMEKYINTKGKQIIGWDEILEGGLAPNATVMSWRGEQGGIEAAREKHDVIMTPNSHAYFDHSQTKFEDSVVIGGYLPLDKVYHYNPMPEALRGTAFEQFVKGAQANVWTEYIRYDSKADYMIFPRLAAFSEAVWTKPEQKSWASFESRLPHFFTLLEKLGSSYSRAYFDIHSEIVPNPTGTGVLWKLETKLPGATILVQQPGAAAPTAYTKPVAMAKNGTYTAFLRFNGKDEKPLKQEFMLHKAVGRKITANEAPNKSYAGNNGINGLLNGLVSQTGLKSAEWCGWSGKDVVLTIDLGTSQALNEVVLHSIESQGSWIYRPSAVTVSLSEDNKTFAPAGALAAEAFAAADWARRQPIALGGKKGRYLRIEVKNYGEIPSGLPGAGHKGWTFIDEIEVR